MMKIQFSTPLQSAQVAVSSCDVTVGACGSAPASWRPHFQSALVMAFSAFAPCRPFSSCFLLLSFSKFAFFAPRGSIWARIVFLTFQPQSAQSSCRGLPLSPRLRRFVHTCSVYLSGGRKKHRELYSAPLVNSCRAFQPKQEHHPVSSSLASLPNRLNLQSSGEPSAQFLVALPSQVKDTSTLPKLECKLTSLEALLQRSPSAHQIEGVSYCTHKGK